MRGRSMVAWYGLTLLATIVLSVALLYAYRSQSPAMPTVSTTQVVQEIQNGGVREIVFEGNRATITHAQGDRVSTPTGGGPDNPILAAANQFNNANPTRQIAIRFENAPQFELLPVFLGFLPLLVLTAVILLAAWAFGRARAPDPYERLARLADLRDRGVLTEDEFQREKRKLIG